MRDVLSKSFVDQVKLNKDFVILSGDHGYALFDALRKHDDSRFVNVGIMEQALVGIAVGMEKVGYKPLIYGLASFIPIRVLEQIKLDVCFSNSPIKIVGDGAGLVYSYLGNSHFCSEDISSLSSMPNMSIFTPGDSHEMSLCLKEFYQEENPGYLRVGKSDNPDVLKKANCTKPYFSVENDSDTCLVSIGSMNGISSIIANDLNISAISVMKVKPLDKVIIKMIQKFKKVIVIEEHSSFGGLLSLLMRECVLNNLVKISEVKHIAFKDKFVDCSGSYQYALSEHDMSFEQIRARVKTIVDE